MKQIRTYRRSCVISIEVGAFLSDTFLFVEGEATPAMCLFPCHLIINHVLVECVEYDIFRLILLYGEFNLSNLSISQ